VRSESGRRDSRARIQAPVRNRGNIPKGVKIQEMRPRCEDKARQLLEKGVDIPNPLTLDLGDEVRVEQISGKGVRIFPGCRIYGEGTVISEGVQIGYEGPVTIENCQIGPRVQLRGGFFRESVFLERSSMGLGAQVREGCILEEQASGAHCVGLKQTILFPYVTLGSLINFCDCLMAGGTSRKNHSEVGSSYIHFNFTPEGDKTTPSLIGDVPRGVMLRERPIFLGGQGGMVGPLRVNFGNVIAAGAILRNDVAAEGRLVIGKGYNEAATLFTPLLYHGFSRMITNNLFFLANLTALRQWYIHVRRDCAFPGEFGELLYRGALQKISMAVQERTSRLLQLAAKMPEALRVNRPDSPAAVLKKEFHEKGEEVCGLYSRESDPVSVAEARERFLTRLHDFRQTAGAGAYTEVIQGLPIETARLGTEWLQRIVSERCERARELLPSFETLRA
jgi:bifunctional UDP-N-acetylglucosamine pyrophosphorylase / glucosamine-1-phosphate N-acetyltransferase